MAATNTDTFHDINTQRLPIFFLEGKTVSVKLAPLECFLAISTINKMEGFNSMEMGERRRNNSLKNATKFNAIIDTPALCITSLAIHYTFSSDDILYHSHGRGI